MRGILSRVPAKAHPQVTKALFLLAMITALIGTGLIAASAETTRTEGALWWKKTTEVPFSERVAPLVIGIVLVAIAVTCLASALWMATLRGRLGKYLTILTGVESMGIQQLAEITNSTKARVYSDLRVLVDSGMVDDLYVDFQAQQVVSKRYVPKKSLKTVVVCEGCGSSNEVIVGIAKKCSYCRRPVIASRA